MGVLIDTSILMRITNADDSQHELAARAIARLHRMGETLYIASQCLIEFWNGATRPPSANGLGLPRERVLERIAGFEAAFQMADESPVSWFSGNWNVDRSVLASLEVRPAKAVTASCREGLSL